MQRLLRARPAFYLIRNAKCAERLNSGLLIESTRAASNGGPGWGAELYLDLSKSSWVANTQQLIESVHDYTHLPWWGTIVVTTVSLRLLITLPLAAYQVIREPSLLSGEINFFSLCSTQSLPDWRTSDRRWTSSSRGSRSRPTGPSGTTSWTSLRHGGASTNRYARHDQRSDRQTDFRSQAKKQWDLLVQRDNCHAFKGTILLWGQIPLWVCMSVALRNMATMMPAQTVGTE